MSNLKNSSEEKQDKSLNLTLFRFTRQNRKNKIEIVIFAAVVLKEYFLTLQRMFEIE